MTVRSSLLALCAVAACTSEPSTQVITGHVDMTKGPLAIRAISIASGAETGGNVITAAAVRTDGSFTLALPAGNRYRLEVLTRTGRKNFVTRDGSTLREVAFSVCHPAEPFDCGGVGDPGMGGGGMCDPNDPTCMQPPKCPDGTTDCDCTDSMDPGCQPPPPCMDPMDPSCNPPPPCMDPTDPNCKCPDGTTDCMPPPCMDPTDPNCMPPPPCMDPMDPNCTCPDGTTDCMPTPCTDSMDPSCGCPPGDPSCCDPTVDPYCKCDAMGNCGGGCSADGTCPPPPCMNPDDPGCAPPCDNPMDPSTCTDPCAKDPTVCGCMMDDPNCWPPPEPCDPDANGMCAPGDGMAPEHVPDDFGCKDGM